ncbi:putative acetyltransferase [Nocardia brasiliensis ATCC 700358]|uniref:Putative acetyltransferase n=2 Tax=Nocardia brasiliensis TaxID=37326 RepID=K0F1I8_NOCB7|nr:putative acetyltransferase [Nocardia brasiliensis ATCC 700358]
MRGTRRVIDHAAMINTRRLAGDDWQIFRDVQLAGLLEAPYSANLTHAQATQRTETDWRHKLSERTLFITTVDDEPAGLAGGELGEHPETSTLVSMWVAPQARGLGVGDALVRTVLEWARGQGHRRTLLWVLDGNEPAERLYLRHGFQRTGRRRAMPRDESLIEVEMALDLASAPFAAR